MQEKTGRSGKCDPVIGERRMSRKIATKDLR
jgi:hypothetical protein